MRKILVLAPHPDDEVLGVGGTIAKWANQGDEIYVAILTCLKGPDFDEQISTIGRQEAKLVHEYLGVKETFFFDFPVLNLQSLGHVKINRAISDLMHDVNPDILFIPFIGDVHQDHKWLSNSAMVAARPFYDYSPSTILAYETLSETYWDIPGSTPDFVPSVFVNISDFLDNKIESMNLYHSQTKKCPHERSIENIKALAKVRGASMHLEAAEAFMNVRNII